VSLVRDRELARDPLSRDAEAHEEERQLAGRARMRVLTLQDEPIEGYRRARHAGIL
jgi:hypothetical protein